MAAKHSHQESALSQRRVENIINQVRMILERYLGGKENYIVYLFGSRAKDEFVENADIDLAISCPFLSENQFRNIKREIDGIRTLYSIDLVHLEMVDQHFRNILLEDAREIDG